MTTETAKIADGERLAAIVEYWRAMLEGVIPQIEADLKERARLAHYARLGIPAPKRGDHTGAPHGQ